MVCTVMGALIVRGAAYVANSLPLREFVMSRSC